jgi:hypothetical protein
MSTRQLEYAGLQDPPPAAHRFVARHTVLSRQYRDDSFPAIPAAGRLDSQLLNEDLTTVAHPARGLPLLPDMLPRLEPSIVGRADHHGVRLFPRGHMEKRATERTQ